MRYSLTWTRFPVTSPRGEDLTISGLRLGCIWFPVTSPRGEDPPLLPRSLMCRRGFQSPPREGRIHARQPDGKVKGGGVSSHLPARGGSEYWELVMYAMLFPVTSPRGEDLPHPADLGKDVACFQSPPREGRIDPKGLNKAAGDVSSHLPARGGSRSMSRSSRGIMRFQSPPREGRILP